MNLLDRYIGLAALKSILLVAFGLTALFSLLEFVDQLRDVGQGNYHVLDALAFVLLTAPLRLLRLVPVAMLLGTLFALGNLSSDSELIAMQSVGISRRQIAGSVLKVGAPVVLALFLLAEFVVPTGQRLADAQRMSRMSVGATIENGNGFWAQGNGQYLNVRWVDLKDEPRDVDIYDFGDTGELKSFIHADKAKVASGDAWQLRDVTRTMLVDGEAQTERLASLNWASFLKPQQVQLLILPPDSMPPVELFRYIHALKESNHQVARLEQAFWTKVGIPLSMAAMVLIATPFVFGPPRARTGGQRLAIGMAIGIVFSLTQQITSLVGLLLDLSPLLAAITPSLLLIAATQYLTRRAAA
jgi:lipopolysaccharide export system permease protein